MASKVYFMKHIEGLDYSRAAAELLKRILSEEHITLEKDTPFKVHFGEKGNITYIKPNSYEGMISYLDSIGILPSFIETNVLYKGERMTKERHIVLALEHGFKQLPIIIADGENGEDFLEIEINKKHFSSCKIGKGFSDIRSMIVVSHFKGHALSGFGGAIKQLAMGCASRGGKLAMHLGTKPTIISRKCIACGLCISHCPVDAITIGKSSFIDHDICIGCAACTAVCPKDAIVIDMKRMMLNLGNDFKEKLSEYAYAAQADKRCIYVSFAIDITSGCDCMGKVMKPIIQDIGIFASTDPVAIDSACFDAAKDSGKKFRGHRQIEYAEEIGLGSSSYKLIEINN